MSGLRPRGFLSVRAAGQAASAHPGEPHGMEVNCDPDCNPITGLSRHWLALDADARELEGEIGALNCAFDAQVSIYDGASLRRTALSVSLGLGASVGRFRPVANTLGAIPIAGYLARFLYRCQ